MRECRSAKLQCRTRVNWARLNRMCFPNLRREPWRKTNLLPEVIHSLESTGENNTYKIPLGGLPGKLIVPGDLVKAGLNRGSEVLGQLPRALDDGIQHSAQLIGRAVFQEPCGQKLRLVCRPRVSTGAGEKVAKNRKCGKALSSFCLVGGKQRGAQKKGGANSGEVLCRL